MSFDSKKLPTPFFILQNSKQVNCLQFSQLNSNILFTGNRAGDFTVYNLELRRNVFTENPNKESMITVAELDEKNWMSSSRDGSIFKWTANNDSTWNNTCIYKKQAYTFCPITVSSNKKSLFIPASESGAIDWLDLSTCQKVNSLGPNSTTRGLLMNLKVIDDFYFLAGYENGEVALIDTRRFEQVSSVDLFSGNPLMCIDYVQTKNFGVAGSSENIVRQFCIDESSLLSSTKSLMITNPGLNCVKIRGQDGKIFVCGGWDSKIRVYSVKKSNLLVVLDFHKEAVNCIDFSSGNLMAVGSNDGIISFWNLYN